MSQRALTCNCLKSVRAKRTKGKEKNWRADSPGLVVNCSSQHSVSQFLLLFECLAHLSITFVHKSFLSDRQSPKRLRILYFLLCIPGMKIVPDTYWVFIKRFVELNTRLLNECSVATLVGFHVPLYNQTKWMLTKSILVSGTVLLL